MDVRAHFERGPDGEIRIVLTIRQGQRHLDLRVYHPAPPDQAAGATATLGRLAALVDKLARALRIAGGQGDEPDLPPAGDTRPQAASARAPAVAGRRSGLPPVGRVTHQDGRGHPRAPLNVPVEYAVRRRSPEAREFPRGRGRTVDLSAEGLQVVLPERLSLFTALTVILHLPGGTLALGCRVVWAQSSREVDPAVAEYRHGLAFTDVGEEERRRLEALVAELGG